jgi:hypothetical protein
MSLRSLRQGALPTQAEKQKAVVINPDAIVPSNPVKFGAQVTADHLFKNDDGEEDDGIPVIPLPLSC